MIESKPNCLIYLEAKALIPLRQLFINWKNINIDQSAEFFLSLGKLFTSGKS